MSGPSRARACVCAETARGKSFASVETAIHGPELDQGLAGCDVLLDLPEKWMALHRCRACGRTWARASCSSRMMEIQHLFPSPVGEEPEMWARERGTSLPLRC